MDARCSDMDCVKQEKMDCNDLNGSHDSGVTSEMESKQSPTCDTSSSEELDDAACTSRKRTRVEAFETAPGKSFDEQAFQAARENRSGYRRQLEARLAQPRIPLHVTQQLRDKDRLIGVLERRVLYLEGLQGESKENCVKMTEEDQTTGELVGLIKDLHTEVDSLHSQISELESINKILQKDNRKKDTELYQNKLQMIANGIHGYAAGENPKDKQIKELQAEIKQLKVDLYRTEDEAADQQHAWRKQVEDLKMQLIDESIRQMETQHRYRGWMAQTLISKEKEIEKLNIIVDKSSGSAITGSDLRVVREGLAEVKVMEQAVRRQGEVMRMSVETLIQDCGRQLQKAVLATNAKCQEMEGKYCREMMLRKRFHNQLVELRGNIRVFCRARPWIKEDGCGVGSSSEGATSSSVLSYDAMDDGLVTIANDTKSQRFEMDKVFDASVSQAQMFAEVKDLIHSCLDGYNVCIFAYGQTGSGKTHTMEGPAHDPGVNQRALSLLVGEAEASVWDFCIQVSSLEVYNETIRDLLNPDPSNKMEVKMRSEGGLHVPGLTSVPVSSVAEINKISERARQNRSTAFTNMNEHSSRSHCVLTVTVTGVNAVTGDRTLGRLNLVDLAGSERVSKSQADGARLKEAQNINKSLSALGDVISALKNKQAHIPYRNSQLTYLLKDSLGGDSKTLMILQVSPAVKNFHETQCTLTFGQRVRSAELGAASKRVEEGGKNTPTGTRVATPSSAAGGRSVATPTSRRHDRQILDKFSTPTATSSASQQAGSSSNNNNHHHHRTPHSATAKLSKKLF